MLNIIRIIVMSIIIFFLPGFILIYTLDLNKYMKAIEICLISFLLSLSFSFVTIYIINKLLKIKITFLNNLYVSILIIIFLLFLKFISSYLGCNQVLKKSNKIKTIMKTERS